jgi:hypothetical protein
MYVCVFTFPFGIILQFGFVRTTFEKPDTIFVIQIFHNGQYLYICIAVRDSGMKRGGLGSY